MGCLGVYFDVSVIWVLFGFGVVRLLCVDVFRFTVCFGY